MADNQRVIVVVYQKRNTLQNSVLRFGAMCVLSVGFADDVVGGDDDLLDGAYEAVVVGAAEAYVVVGPAQHEVRSEK